MSTAVIVDCSLLLYKAQCGMLTLLTYNCISDTGKTSFRDTEVHMVSDYFGLHRRGCCEILADGCKWTKSSKITHRSGSNKEALECFIFKAKPTEMVFQVPQSSATGCRDHFLGHQTKDHLPFQMVGHQPRMPPRSLLNDSSLGWPSSPFELGSFFWFLFSLWSACFKGLVELNMFWNRKGTSFGKICQSATWSAATAGSWTKKKVRRRRRG